MRAVVQRVTSGSVTVENREVGAVKKGLVVLLGVGKNDTDADVDYLAEKIARLRIFEDENGKLNLSVLDVGGEVLAVSQFTLYGDCRRGRRPSFSGAAAPEAANELYQQFVHKLQQLGLKVATGRFQTHMVVNIVNDGPVTLLLDSKKEF
ncbi:D-tyrosyl-tRNA(Tyr) deacylase [Desulfohalotomaculum tongense]|uniref:D-aminoacyl-tRNA deacylase n=1 Tax=Desulforadius tongensis TaxID=1216062 RepID=UPI00195A0664|nr:D-aminoacyl-tRNA deacylase [Desulforadius tongensis]MBM7855005.1 D-tyrosyl-tRNA(Tyr) deacylase [Desulforadius tongensis]